MKPVLNQALAIVIVIFGIVNSYGQGKSSGHLLHNIEAEIWNNPQIVLDVVNAYLYDSQDALIQVKQQNLSARTYYAMGQYDKSLEASFRALQLFPQKNVAESAEATEAYAFLRLTLAKIDLPEATIFIPDRFKISEPEKNGKSILLIDALALAEKGDSAGAISLLKQAYTLAENEFVWNDRLGISPSLLLLAWKKSDEVPEELISWLDDEATDSDKRPLTTTAKIAVEQLLADFHFKNRNHDAAVKALENCIHNAAKLKNHGWQAELYGELAKNYLAINNGAKYQHSVNQAVSHNQKDEKIKNKSINITQTSLSSLQAYDVQLLTFEEKNKQKRANIILISLLSIALILSIVYAVRISRTAELLQFAKANTKFAKSNADPSASSTTPASKSSSVVESKISTIPAETEQVLLAKLKHFEAGKRFLSSDMSLAQLSTLLETNSKYVSEIINRHKGKNFNAYINELRIKYIIKKLHNNPTYLNYKVSYLAEESGFASHSSFTTVFKGVIGMSPARFIQLIVKENEAVQQSS